MISYHHFCSAIILASGKGERFGKHTLPKQMWPLNGKPVFIHTLEAFDRSLLIHEMILVVPKEDILNYREIIKQYKFSKEIRVVGGGNSRTESSARGIESVHPKSKYVAIHDSVRCLITTEDIDKVVREAYKTNAAIAGTPSTDTIKKVNCQLKIEETIPRETIWLAQTPQIFEANLFRGCLYSCIKNNEEVTDDASVVERFGVKVSMVDTGKTNMKITYYSDIAIAKAILDAKGDPLS